MAMTTLTAPFDVRVAKNSGDLERAISDAYDQVTAWRWVAERLAAELRAPATAHRDGCAEIAHLVEPENAEPRESVTKLPEWARRGRFRWRFHDPQANRRHFLGIADNREGVVADRGKEHSRHRDNEWEARRQTRIWVSRRRELHGYCRQERLAVRG